MYLDALPYITISSETLFPPNLMIVYENAWREDQTDISGYSHSDSLIEANASKRETQPSEGAPEGVEPANPFPRQRHRRCFRRR
jgi:hypothetical protein